MNIDVRKELGVVDTQPQIFIKKQDPDKHAAALRLSDDSLRFRCNICGKLSDGRHNYCPSCGAMMTPYKGGEDE